jgi:hypothetical protein
MGWSKARGPIYSNLHRDLDGKNRKMSFLAAHICCGTIDQQRSASHRAFAWLSAVGSPGPLLTPVRLHTRVSSESRPPCNWSTHRPAPPKDRGPAVRVTAAMNPGSRWCRLRRRSKFVSTSGSSAGSSGMPSGGTAQDGSLSAQAGPRPRDGPAGPHASAGHRCRPGPWSGPTDPTVLPCRIRSITPCLRCRCRTRCGGCGCSSRMCCLVG